MPLQASSMSMTPVSMWTRLPAWTLGMPMRQRSWTVAQAVRRMREFDTRVSRMRGHGTAVRMKAKGKLNHRSHATPPASERRDREMPTQAMAYDHAQMLRSGAASWSQRAGSVRRAKKIATNAAYGTGGEGCGRVSQRDLQR